MKKTIIIIIAVFLLTVGFVYFPFQSGDLHIRIYFDDVIGDNCALYYTTDNSEYFSEDKCIRANIDSDKKVDFLLNSKLEGHITGLRLDWPEEDQVLCVKDVTISSAGVIQKEYDPCYFLGEPNVIAENCIPAKNLLSFRKRAYIQTTAKDPYMILSPELISQIQDCYSHYRLTRLAICVFVFGCFCFWKKEVFVVGQSEGK